MSTCYYQSMSSVYAELRSLRFLDHHSGSTIRREIRRFARPNFVEPNDAAKKKDRRVVRGYGRFDLVFDENVGYVPAYKFFHVSYRCSDNVTTYICRRLSFRCPACLVVSAGTEMHEYTFYGAKNLLCAECYQEIPGDLWALSDLLKRWIRSYERKIEGYKNECDRNDGRPPVHDGRRFDTPSCGQIDQVRGAIQSLDRPQYRRHTEGGVAGTRSEHDLVPTRAIRAIGWSKARKERLGRYLALSTARAAELSSGAVP